MGLFDWFISRLVQGRSPESSFHVEFNDKTIHCTRPDGDVESMEWNDLKCVLLRNTDAGPTEPDVFWVLISAGSECLIPQGATGEPAFLERLQKLPDFNNEAVIASATCVNKQDFVCWKKVDL